jgi:hypothetical protein
MRMWRCTRVLLLYCMRQDCLGFCERLILILYSKCNLNAFVGCYSLLLHKMHGNKHIKVLILIAVNVSLRLVPTPVVSPPCFFFIKISL